MMAVPEICPTGTQDSGRGYIEDRENYVEAVDVVHRGGQEIMRGLCPFAIDNQNEAACYKLLGRTSRVSILPTKSACTIVIYTK